MSKNADQNARIPINSKQATSRRDAGASLEQAFFDGGIMPYVVIIGAIAIFGVELTANAARGEGAVSIIHFLVVGLLEVTLIAFLARNLYRRLAKRSSMSRQARGRRTA